jgi:hypothetical protein
VTIEDGVLVIVMIFCVFVGFLIGFAVALSLLT